MPRRRRAAAALLALAVVALGVLTLAPAQAVAGDSVAGRLPSLEHQPDDVRATVDDVLDRREYDRPSPTLLQRVRNWLRDKIGDLLGRLVAGGGAQVVAWIVLLAGLGLVGFLLFRLARGMTPDAARRAAEARATKRSPAEWMAEADAHEAAGRFRQALRCRYRALVAELGERGLVDEVPGRTAGEYRREVSESAPTVAPEFAGATDLFERAWYGNRSTGPDDAGRFRQLADRVLAETKS